MNPVRNVARNHSTERSAARFRRLERTRQSVARAAGAVVAAWILWACATSGSGPTTPVIPGCNLALVHGIPSSPSLLFAETIEGSASTTDTLDASVYLVGDAGYPVEDSGSVLAHVQAQIVAEAARTELAANHSQQWVIYLGDNAYPAGLPPASGSVSIEFADAACALQQQVEAVPAPARAVFVSGNHDWRPTGCVRALNAQLIGCLRSLQSKDPAAIQREAKFINERGDGRISFLPPGGCPGPGELTIGSRLVLLPFDSEWMLRHADGLPDRNCQDLTFSAVVNALSARIRRAPAGDFVMLAAHHPMHSGGEHGNACSGPSGLARSAVTDARRAAEVGEDFSGEGYKELRRQLIGRLSRAGRSIAYASGHDHNLQVFAGGPPGRTVHYLVSGAGSSGTHESSCVRWQAGMVYPFSVERFAGETPNGFMRLDLFRPSGVRLTVFAVGETGVLSRSATFVLE